MNRTNRIILVSVAVILLCCVIIAGATFALFTEGKTVTTHLKSGKLDVEFYRDRYSYTILDADGTLKPITGGTRVDFTKPVGENFFGFEGSKDNKFQIVPGSEFSADMQLVNKGTTAFTYDIEIIYDTDDDTNFDLLADQLLVTVGEYSYAPNGDRVERVTKSARLSDATWQSEEGYLEGTLKLGTTAVSSNLFVRVQFVSDGTGIGNVNNNVMSKSVYFDLVLTCVQYNGENS